MIIFKQPADIHSFLLSTQQNNTSTGFIPTMGALHQGHIALVIRAGNENNLTICSIFVNPTQFNDQVDFEKYPATIEEDICLLEKAGCDVLFLPSVQAIYPNGIIPTRKYDLGSLETMLEGKFRPGHFQGVCQVVHRLLEIVKPTKLYLGQKDFQQCLVIKKLVELLGIETDIVVCPTFREADQLAMSSRNRRLNESGRLKAPLIYKTLLGIKNKLKAGETGSLTATGKQALEDEGFRVDYVEIADAKNLDIIQKWDGDTPVVVVAAAFINEVRLIDNVRL